MRERDFNLCFYQRDLSPPDVLTLPNKPVWLWSTVGTLAVPVRHGRTEVLKGVSGSFI